MDKLHKVSPSNNQLFSHDGDSVYEHDVYCVWRYNVIFLFDRLGCIQPGVQAKNDRR